MLVQVGLENGINGRSLAWAVEHPGCFAYGENGQNAIIEMAKAIPAYIAWLESHTSESWFNPAEIDIRLVEVWECYQINQVYDRVQEGFEVNAWFQMDWKPVRSDEIDHGLQILKWSRSDLLSLIQYLKMDQVMDRKMGEDWSVQDVLGHIADVERWYLDRLGLDEKFDLVSNGDVFQQLGAVRSRLEAVLPEMAGVEKVIGTDGEFWSPRKLLRRAAWHEIDHINQIQRMIQGKNDL